MDLDEMLRIDRCRGMDELITFEPIRIIVRMPEPDCFLRYRISAAMRNFITSGKSHVYVLAARRAVLKWFYSPRAVGTLLSEVHALYRVHF